MSLPDLPVGRTILVCGGRDYSDFGRVVEILDILHDHLPIEFLVHGDARGADRLGGRWARMRYVTEIPVPADWATHGRRAGFLRNTRMLEMLDTGDLVVAFPGGRGTMDTVQKARLLDLDVLEIA